MTTGQPDCLQFPAFNPSPHRGLAHHTRAGNVLDFDPFLHGLVKAANRCKPPSLFIGTQAPYLDTEGFQFALAAFRFVTNGLSCGFCGIWKLFRQMNPFYASGVTKMSQEPT
jgi:hypothetical protein